jgi:hypothetical protein
MRPRALNVLRQALWSTGLALALIPAGAADGKEREALYEATVQAFWWGDFDSLERLHQRASRPGARDENGSTLLSAHRNALDRTWSVRGGSDAYMNEVERLTLQWVQTHPQSPLAHTLYARTLVAQAWAVRGTGYASSVPPQAWADFKRLLSRAAEHLAKNAKVAMQDPTAYSALISAGRGLGWSQEQLWSIGKEGLRQHPEADDIYFSVLTSMLPKWGGSVVQVDRFIDEAVTMTRQTRGQEFYARLYGAAADEHFEHALFEDSAAQWPRMKQGFQDRLSRYPSQGNLNGYAYFACLAKDKITFVELMDTVGPKPILDRWGRNPERMFAGCKRWGDAQ